MRNTPTFGPFTGGQLTLIIVVALLTLVPTTVWAAATFSNAAVFDPASGRRAAVDAERRLKIGDGAGRLSIDDGGASLTVNGVTRDAAPANFVNFGGGLQDGCNVMYAPPQGKALVVTWLFLDVYANPSPGPLSGALVYTGGSCFVPEALIINPSGTGVESVTPEPGLIVPAGQSLRVYRAGANFGADFYGSGYLIPASQAP